MPVDTPHPLYSANLATWQRCRAAYDGEDAIKAAGETYLPRIDQSQSTKSYNSYRIRASYYEAVGRTIDGFVGTIARKSHTFVLPAALDDLVADVTADGMGLLEFTKKLCSEVLLVARCGLLTDFSETAQRPYLSFYPAEAILNWSDDGVILSETVYERDDADRFKVKAVQQIRQLQITDGAYTATIWRKMTDALTADKWVVVETRQPTIKGRTLDTIPFQWISPLGSTSRIEKPPLLGLINIALSHYRTSADLEHGRHFTALPTLYVTGSKDSEAISVGPGSVIMLQDPAAKVGYADFQGQGLGSLETALATKEAQMATLGAAVLTQQKAGVEAAETARIRTAGQTSLLSGVVSSVEESLSAALRTACLWAGGAQEPEVKLNREFVDNELDPQTMASLVKAYQAGAISLETFLFTLQTADMLPPDMDIAKEAATLEAAKAAAANAALQAAQAANQPAKGQGPAA